MHERIAKLTDLGQSLWFDFIRRGMLGSGQLQGLVDEGVRGVTSNPTILHKAITETEDYDQALEELRAAGRSSTEIYTAIVTEDIRAAADVLRPVYDATGGADGFVSLEVDPSLAYDAQGTIEQGRQLFAAVDRPNVMIKVPATEEGLPAIRALIGRGINVNVTLIFSCDVYRRVIKAYLAGLEDLGAAGKDLSRVSSVASFFVSRVDTKADKQIDERMAGGEEQLVRLRGKAGIANSKEAYAIYQEFFGGERFARLRARGARVQRPLWASTSTKDPAYPDTLYVDELIGPNTVNTVPPATLDAFKDHGRPERTIDRDLEQARQDLADLSAAGISLDLITEELRSEGVEAFAKSYNALMQALEAKVAAI